MKIVIGFVALSLLLATNVAFAGQITGGPVGLSNPENVITFNEVSLPQWAEITTQFQHFGATFEGVGTDIENARGGDAAVGFSGAYLYSGLLEGPQLPVVIHFNKPVDAAAVAATDLGGSWNVSAYLGGVRGTLVDQFNIYIPGIPGVGFVGFTGELFDTLVFSGEGPLGLDTLEFGTPEPGSLALFGLGLAVVGMIRRRRSAQ